jgi:hypothetical protein
VDNNSWASPWHSSRWRKACFVTHFTEAFRCKDPALGKLLKNLRVRRPAARGGDYSVAQICRGRKAWKGDKPTVAAIGALLEQVPHTTLLAVTRRGAALLNDLALEAKYAGYRPLATLGGDVDSDPENYDNGQLKKVQDLKPSKLLIHRGMPVYLTRNVDKEHDYCNGMAATVEHFDESTGALRVKTTTGFRLAIWPWTDVDMGNLVYYPVRPGWASTILKFQGAELSHVTVYLDAASVPGAAYTAISRVSYMADFLIGGNVKPVHFTPVR